MTRDELVVQYIERESGLIFGEDWIENDNLLQMGILDSLALMKLLMFIEDILDKQLNDDEINYEKLTSLEKIKSWYLT